MEKISCVFKKSHPDFGYFIGDIAELPADIAAELHESQHVTIFIGENEKAANRLPDDMPLRDILSDAGFTSVDEVAAAGDSLLDIKGVGAKSLSVLREYLNK